VADVLVEQRPSKVDKYGLADVAVELRAKGWGTTRIAKELTARLSDKVDSRVEFSPSNIDAFFKGLQKEQNNSMVLSNRVTSLAKQTQLKILSNWEKIDDRLEKLLGEASKIQERCVGFNKAGEPLIVKEKNLLLLNNVLANIAKISETRAKVMGQISSGTNKIIINNIENQYNNLMSIIADAEDKFPGVAEFVMSRLETHKPNK
jgi:hypothetical protein